MRTITAVAALLSTASMTMAQSVVTIQVGAEETTAGGIFQYIPANVTASNGTIVNFVWQGSPGNHTVTQSTAQSPCQPMSSGFDSGFLFIPTNTTANFPSWNLTITNDQEPIYFYCAQTIPGPHCGMFGMVGSINAPASGPGSWGDVVNTALASNATAPGEPTPGASLTGVDVNVTAPPGPVGTSSNGILGFDLPAATPAPSAASSGASGASTAGSTAAPSGSATGGSSTGAPAPTGGSSGAMANVVSGAALVLSALLGTLLL